MGMPERIRRESTRQENSARRHDSTPRHGYRGQEDTPKQGNWRTKGRRRLSYAGASSPRDSSRSHYSRGREANRDGRVAAALKHFLVAHRTDPSAVKPLLSAANMYLKLGEPDKARPLYEKLLAGTYVDDRTNEYKDMARKKMAAIDGQLGDLRLRLEGEAAAEAWGSPAPRDGKGGLRKPLPPARRVPPALRGTASRAARGVPRGAAGGRSAQSAPPRPLAPL